MQFHIVGRGEGTFHVRFENGGLEVLPTPAQDAEAFIECSYDNLLDMARGFVTTDKLFLSGQLKLSGNLAKGFEVRYLLTRVLVIQKGELIADKDLSELEEEGIELTEWLKKVTGRTGSRAAELIRKMEEGDS